MLDDLDPEAGFGDDGVGGGGADARGDVQEGVCGFEQV